MAAPKKLTPEQRQARDVEIWRMRCAGWTQQQIADHLGLAPQTVAGILAKQRQTYAEAHTADVEQQLNDEAAALDEQVRLWTERALDGGRGAFRAGELVLRFRESRRKLLGLDRPAKLEVSGTVVTPVDLEIQSLYEQLGINDPTVATGSEIVDPTVSVSIDPAVN